MTDIETPTNEENSTPTPLKRGRRRTLDPSQLRQNISISIDPNLNRLIEKIAEKHGHKKSRVVETMLKYGAAKAKAHYEGNEEA